MFPSHLMVVQQVRGLEIAVDVPMPVHILHRANQLMYEALDLP